MACYADTSIPPTIPAINMFINKMLMVTMTEVIIGSTVSISTPMAISILTIFTFAHQRKPCYCQYWTVSLTEMAAFCLSGYTFCKVNTFTKTHRFTEFTKFTDLQNALSSTIRDLTMFHIKRLTS